MDDIDMAGYGRALHEAAVADTPQWVANAVMSVMQSQQLRPPEGTDVATLIGEAGDRAATFVDAHLGQLVDTDIDRQATTPLSVFRDAARFPVEVLHQLGAQPVHRGDVSRWAFPNDPFGVTPENLADVGEATHTAGITWGAAKASLHLQRRRAEGQL